MKNLHVCIKRIIDFVGSIVGGLIILPMFLLIALAIKLTSKGPVFFKQERLGKDGEIFSIMKFRTMVVNAEQMGTGLSIHTEQDSRITKVGKFLRATSLDELPQLWNVVIGEMSLVGPRPPVPYYPYKYEEYSDLQRKRFEMKPGITGLSQITMRNSVTWDEKIPVDIDYIENFTIWLDIKILFSTLLIIFKKQNIYPSTYKDNESKNI